MLGKILRGGPLVIYLGTDEYFLNENIYFVEISLRLFMRIKIIKKWVSLLERQISLKKVLTDD